MSAIAKLAAESLAKAKNDMAKAERLLTAALTPEIRKELISYAVHEAIRAAARSDRRVRIRTMGAVDPNRERHMKGLVAAGIRNYLMMVLPGGCILGEAKLEDLESARDLWLAHAESNARRARWCERIIASLPKGKRVRDAFTNEKLQELSAEVRLEEAA